MFPVELTITRIDVPGPPTFTGHLRDITERRRSELELKASRARIVEAGYEARRRIERDLHDGAQQQLVSAAMNLRAARQRLESDADQAAELLDEAAADLAAAMDELRELARGIHPAVLTEGGLDPALRGLVRRSAVPAVLIEAPAERLPAPIEAAAYFVVAEGLTNAARYANAELVEIEVAIRDQQLVVQVRDDGIGGADTSTGSGLRGLADRVAALDGSFTVLSAFGAGTTLRASLPCAGGLRACCDRRGLSAAARRCGAAARRRRNRGRRPGRRLGGVAAQGPRPQAGCRDRRHPHAAGHSDEGIRAAGEIRAALPGTGILILSQYVEEYYVRQLLEDGAAGVGYLLKDRVADVETFVRAVQRVAAGEAVLDPRSSLR